jgi:acetone carboxylase gamma subunit
MSLVKDYGLHPAQDVAIACNELRRAVRELSDADDALDRYWWTVRPTVCLACGHVHDHEWTLCEHCGEDSAI